MTRSIINILLIVLTVSLAGAGFPSDAPARSGASKDSSIVLKGGEEGTVFKSLTVEGEDRVKIEFERPPLELDLDPSTAPGLDWDSTWEILGRNQVDFVSPLVDQSARQHSPYLPRPWLDEFRTGDLVRFRPALEDVEKWRLEIVDSRGRPVISFHGEGGLPDEIGWDGRRSEGGPAPPGLTYSYVLEAYDRAGNKRNFVGKGFELPPYQLSTEGGVTLIFSGQRVISAAGGGPGREPAELTIIMDAASRINQIRRPDHVIRIEATARTYQEAAGLAEMVHRSMSPLLLGDPAGIQQIAEAQPDAPSDGTVAIVVSR